MEKYNFIDLFAGCGGLSEGFCMNSKMNPIAHVEWEKPMVDTLRNRLQIKWGHSSEQSKKTVVQFDIQCTDELLKGNWSEESIKQYGKYNSKSIVEGGLDFIVGEKKVDIIIGGPPCQAYSIAGRAQDPNSMRNDYRNYLFESFVKVVDHYKPTVFVFENVPGMLSATIEGELIINKIYSAFKEIGYEIRSPEKMKDSIYLSSDYGVPQNRKRVLIFGVRKSSEHDVEEFYSELNNLKCLDNKKTVRDCIGFLPKIIPLINEKKNGRRNISHVQKGGEIVAHHTARFHNKRDINVFREWLQYSMNKLPNIEKIQYYNRITNKSTKHNKYRALEWDNQSPTIVAHLQKDGLMFIHPDIEQLRSITVREAALLQSFPLDYKFSGSNSSCFKMIGNAVPVNLSKKIAEAIEAVLEDENEKT